MFLTKARLAYDDKYLHVSFLCRDNGFHATMKEFNDRIYLEDVVEIFIDDDCDRKSYIEIEVSPINTVLHYIIQNDLNGRYIGFARTEQCIESNVTVENADRDSILWSAEFSIPFREFITAKNTPPLPGDKWLFNLFRIKRSNVDSAEEYSYSITQGASFHDPRSFVSLIFE